MKKILILLLIATTLAACSSRKDEKEKLIKEITEMEQKFELSVKAQKPDPQIVRDLANAYKKYSGLFPRDTISPGMLYKAAVINMKYIMDFNEAINLFVKMKEKYPKYRETPMSLYSAAYIYNDLLKNPEKARECYELLIEDYPEHALTKEAKVLIQFVGKSDEELLNAIIGKNIDTSAPVEEKK